MGEESSTASSKPEADRQLLRTPTEELLAFMRSERWIMLVLLLGVTGATIYFLVQLSKRLNAPPMNGLHGGHPNGGNGGYPSGGYLMPSFQIINQLPPSSSTPALNFPLPRQDFPLPRPVISVASTNSQPAVDDYSSPVSYSTRLFTTELSPTQPIRVFQAVGGKFWRIQLRNAGPPGSFALISTDSSQLQNTGVVNNEMIILPAGGFNDFQLRPDQAIFARSNMPNVALSVSAFVER